MVNQEVQNILDFWFGNLQSLTDYHQDKTSMWFGDGAAYDELIKEKFHSLHKQACRGDLRGWELEAHSMLALIILFDQFSRHIYRNQARSFIQDKQAIMLVQQGIEKSFDKELFFIQRKFFYMPLMHAEDIGIQTLSIKMFTQLCNDVPTELQDMYAKSLSFAQSHYYVIEKFGRFPELNEILGRASTCEELDFLATGKYQFL